MIDTDFSDFLSPNGRWLAYPANPTGRWEIFLQPFPTGRARRLTKGPGAKLGLRWFPDSLTLAYLYDETGREDYSLYLQPLDGPARKIETGFPVEPNFAISPDRQIACFESGTGRLYVLPHLITDLGCPGRFLTFSPDGRYLAAVAETDGQDTSIFLVRRTRLNGNILNENIPRLSDSSAAVWCDALTDLGKTLPAQDPVFSPDSSTLAFSVLSGERSTLALVSVSTGEFTPLDIPPAGCRAQSRHDPTQPSFSPDGNSLVCITSNGPESQIADISIVTHHLSLVTSPAPGVCSHPAFTPDGDSVIFAFENAENPPALWRYIVKTGLMKPLLPFSGFENGGRRGMGVEHITYPSLDGLPVPALLYRPENPTGAAIVYIHGGPNWLSQNHWDEHINDFLEQGWTVLAPNYRGSTGYGRSWQLANRFDPGGGDCDDILAAADFLIREQLASPEKIAVTGRSYGGYLTLMALIRAPEKWCAGSAFAPFFSFFATENVRPDVLRWDIENFGDPRERPEFFRERSPQFHLEKIQAPLQLISGENDFRCPAAESSAARDELARLGKPVELCLYPSEGHVFLKSKNILDARQKRLDFLAKHLIQE